MGSLQGRKTSERDSHLQRDRFVAFSFASTDLVFEVNSANRLSFVSGAARELTGHSTQDLTGVAWLDLFNSADQAKLVRAVGGLKGAGRTGPIAVRLSRIGQAPVSVVFGACRLPHREGFIYCTLSASNMALALQGPSAHRDEKTGLLDSKGFSEMAKGTLEASVSLGNSVELTLIDLSGGGLSEPALGKEQKGAFLSDLGNVLCSRAVGGELAGQLSEGRFGVIHDPSVDGAEIEQEVLGLAQSFAPEAGTIALGRSTLDLEAGGLSQEEVGHALVYTINQFATATDGSVTIKSLQAGFQDLAKQTKSRIARLKSVVADRRFDLHLQPIVDLKNREVRHFELLLRFQKGHSPYPWITFAEGVGMIQDLDMAVFTRAIEFLRTGTSDKRVSVAVNLSGQSISNERFVDDLISLLLANQSLSHRLLIELTESSRIAKLEQVNKIILALRGVGFAIGLDDFGAGAASFQYLRGLDVEFVKFDGDYVRSILDSDRDLLMLKAMAGLCRDLDIRTVAEMIEQEEQAVQLKALGIGLGQGYLFGKPAPARDYGIEPPAVPKPEVRSIKFADQRFNPITGAEIVRSRG